MLIAYALHEIALSRRDKDGVSEREHLLAAQRMLGQQMPELVSPHIPDWALYLWDWFRELSQGRQGGLGPSPLSWSDILAWAKLTGRRLSPWETHTLRAIDAAWLSLAPKK